MSQQNTSSIFLGVWTDWTQGKIYGATITLSHRNGTLLTSFAATFTTFACAQLWLILCFLIYHLRSKTKPEDGLTHQRQSVLRNTTSLGASWIFAQQAWKWHGTARSAAIRSFGWVIVALGFAGASGLASTFTAYTTSKASPYRLVVSDSCGFWSPVVRATGQGNLTSYALSKVADTLTAANYARTCYTTNADPVQCRKYINPNLNWTSTANVACPFESGMCSTGDQGAFAMESGLIDSMSDLGINSPPSERLNLRKKTTCSPIVEDKHYTKEDDVVFYQYGPISTVSDFTTLYNTTSRRSLVGYAVTNIYSYASQQSAWVPIPALNRTDADISMVFIASNSVQYTYPNRDPIFVATQPSPFATGRYESDLWVGSIACAEQYQVCNPSKVTCSSWMGAIQYFIASASSNGTTNPPLWQGHGMTSRQIAINERIAWVLYNTNVYSAITTRGASALRLQDHLFNLFQTANVPDNQWTVEVSGWFEASLARLQQEISAFATGPTAARDGMSETFTSDETKALCTNQLTRETGDTMNFSLLGLCLVFGIGTLIALISFSLGSLSNIYYNLRPQKSYKQIAWDADFFLQAHRKGFVENESVEWTSDAVPITTEPTKMIHYSALPSRYESVYNDGNRTPNVDGIRYTGSKGEQVRVVNREMVFGSG